MVITLRKKVMSKKRKTEGETNFWPVYSDIAWVVVIIMLLFILSLYLITPINLIGSNIEMKKQQEDLKREFFIGVNDTSGYKYDIINIEEDGNLQLFVFSADHLFQFDKADFKNPQSRKNLREFGEILQKNLARFIRIQIEGHASWEPGAGLADERYNRHNWDLSVKRALAVGEMFMHAGVEGEKISVAGRSYYVPFNASLSFQEANTKSREAERNRRINVIIYYSERGGQDMRILR